MLGFVALKMTTPHAALRIPVSRAEAAIKSPQHAKELSLEKRFLMLPCLPKARSSGSTKGFGLEGAAAVPSPKAQASPPIFQICLTLLILLCSFILLVVLIFAYVH